VPLRNGLDMNEKEVSVIGDRVFTPRASIIISVYNRIDYLRLVLAGLEIQTCKDFEVIISDDGSNAEFIQALQELIKSSSLKIKHNWHPDEGFRKNMILNKSIQLSVSDYLIFIDGDCIPHPHFIEEHLKHTENKVCLCGRRINLSKRITKKLTPEKVKNNYLQRFTTAIEMFFDFFRLKLYHVMNGFYVKNRLLLKYLNRKERGLLGSNFSLHKADLIAINGFDERYTKPTFGEDSDIEFRLRLTKEKFKPLMNIAVQYHCYHVELPRPLENKELFEKIVKEERAYTLFGIIK